MKKALVTVAIAFIGVFSAPGVKAQDVGGVFDMGQLANTLTQSAAMRAQANRDAARLKGRSRRGTRTATMTGSTRFTPSIAVRKRNLAAFVAKSRAVDPQGSARLEQSFAKQDPIAAIAPGLKRYHLQTNDVADAMTAYLVSAWYGVRGSNEDPPQAHVRGVRDQVRRALLSTPSFASASNATRQQIAEASLVQVMVTDALVTGAKGNPTQMTQARNAIRQGALRTFKLDLSRMQLTNSGLSRL